MDLKQLRAFLSVAETGSVTRAAELLNLVQPAVSRQLQLLEEDLGAPLFERTRQGMNLTGAGQSLVEYARRALNELDRARAEINPAKGAIGGIVTIGLLPSTCDLLASALVSAVNEKYPGIRVRIAMGYAGTLQAWLENGEVDAALLYDPKSSAMIKTEMLLEERMCVVGLPKDRLKLSRPVSLKNLAGKPLILPSMPHGTRVLVEHACSLLGLELNVVAETNAMSVQKNLVLGGHGLTIMPLIAVAADISGGSLSAALLSDPVITRKVVLALPNNRQLNAPVRHAVAELVNCMKDAILSGQWPEAKWLA